MTEPHDSEFGFGFTVGFLFGLLAAATFLRVLQWCFGGPV